MQLLPERSILPREFGKLASLPSRFDLETIPFDPELLAFLASIRYMPIFREDGVVGRSELPGSLL